MNQDPKSLSARAGQLVRKPVGEVFAAFVEPHLLVQFWLAAASAPLEAGKKVHWEFMVQDAVADVEVLALERDRLIRVRWPDGSETEWTFTPRGAEETVVHITQSGFSGTPEETIAAALDATQGYSIVLSGLKVLLESPGPVELVADKARLIELGKAGAR